MQLLLLRYERQRKQWRDEIYAVVFAKLKRSRHSCVGELEHNVRKKKQNSNNIAESESKHEGMEHCAANS
jgi:hypothetical protein